MYFGLYYYLTLPYRVSVATIANDICLSWYSCHVCFSFLNKTLGTQ